MGQKRVRHRLISEFNIGQLNLDVWSSQKSRTHFSLVSARATRSPTVSVRTFGSWFIRVKFEIIFSNKNETVQAAPSVFCPNAATSAKLEQKF